MIVFPLERDNISIDSDYIVLDTMAKSIGSD